MNINALHALAAPDDVIVELVQFTALGTLAEGETRIAEALKNRKLTNLLQQERI